VEAAGYSLIEENAAHRRIARELDINRETVGKCLLLARSKPAISTAGPNRSQIRQEGVQYQQLPAGVSCEDSQTQRVGRSAIIEQALSENDATAFRPGGLPCRQGCQWVSSVGELRNSVWHIGMI